MRHFQRTLHAIIVIVMLAIIVWANDFNRTVSVTGGSAQRLSAILVANGYGGTTSLEFLTLCNPTGNANDLKFGQSDVATNGVPLSPGDCNTWPAGSQPTDASSIYLWTSTTENAYVILRSK